MAVDLRKIKKLIELVEESGISELEVRDGEETIRVARPVGLPREPAEVVVAAAAAAAPAVAAPAAVTNKPLFDIRAPMAGTFYHAPEPGAAPFVAAGQAVEAGDVVCIIESMKMMNEIKAERPGVCHAVLAGNGQPIGTGDVLFRFH